MHRVVASPGINLIDVKLSGFLDAGELGELGRSVLTLFTAGKAKPGYIALLDLVECSIQSQETLAGLAQMTAHMPPAKRIAVICGSYALRMQLGRVLQRPYLRVVPDRQAALAWLIRAIEPAQAAA